MSILDERKRAVPPTPDSERYEDENGKRRRVEEHAGSSFVAPSLPSSSLPDLPLLYHTALSAQHSANFHLQQAFLPPDVTVPRAEPVKMVTPTGQEAIKHDPHAAAYALRFLVMALDLLRVGLDTPGIPDREYAAFALEFSNVASKILDCSGSMKALSEADRSRVDVMVDETRLQVDVEQIISRGLSIAQSPHLQPYREGLQIASAKLALRKGKAALGRKIIKEAYQQSYPDQYAHRYRLYLLLIDNPTACTTPDAIGVTEDLEEEARVNGHFEVVQIAHLARLSALIRQRRWDSLLKVFEESAALLDPTPEILAGFNDPDPGVCQYMLFHFLILRALVQGRAGEEDGARTQLKRLYQMMDSAAGSQFMLKLRANGGVLQVKLASPSAVDQVIVVQSTPVNVLYASAYLATVVARGDVQGAAKNCRTLSYARALRASEATATVGDMWDCGFSFEHSLADALDTRAAIDSVRIEVMMEEAFALICRNAFVEADKLLTDIATRLRRYRTYHIHSAQLTLLYGQFAHAMGLSHQAKRYYEAAQLMLAPGSELRLIVDIGLLATQGHLEGLANDHKRATEVKVLADQCRSGSNQSLHGVGFFLGSLAETERVPAKRQVSHAYEISRKGNPLLHGLIFAFTTGTHVYGERDRTLKLLDAGATLSQRLGGKDRQDGVGQAVLGLWFAIKLRDFHRLSGQFDLMQQTESVVTRHKQRIDEIQRFAYQRFHPV